MPRLLQASQFSLQSLMVFVSTLGLALGLNTWTAAEKTYSGKCLFFGRGEFDIDVLQAQRGWPFTFLDHSQPVAQGTGDEMLQQGWPHTNPDFPRVTHTYWLLVDALVALVTAAAVPWVVQVGITGTIGRKQRSTGQAREQLPTS